MTLNIEERERAQRFRDALIRLVTAASVQEHGQAIHELIEDARLLLILRPRASVVSNAFIEASIGLDIKPRNALERLHAAAVPLGTDLDLPLPDTEGLFAK